MLIVIELIPGVADMIFDEMFELMRMATDYFGGA